MSFADARILCLSAVAGGFAIVQPNSVLSINAVEGYPLEDFSPEAVRAQIAEAQKVISGGGSEQEIAEAKIELEVRAELNVTLRVNPLVADMPSHRSLRAFRPTSNDFVVQQPSALPPCSIPKRFP
jgi:hypothetical protein